MLLEKTHISLDKFLKEQEAFIGIICSYYEDIIVAQEQKYEAKIAALEEEVQKLKDQLAKNSSNSSKPPSSDGFKKRKSVPNQRKKTERSKGGQQGHKGHQLKMTDSPDKVVIHQVTQCANCHQSLVEQAADKITRRQVLDIPPLHFTVTEHQSEQKTCRCGCLNKANFPAHVSNIVQYGPNVKGLVVYLQDYQLLPFARTQELLTDLFGHTISQGTLYNIKKTGYDNLATFEKNLKEILIASSVAGFDETGLRINEKCFWLHSCSTDSHVCYTIDKKRGQIGMDAAGILPNFEGIAVHDFWRSYYLYNCTHALCNAHLLRELAFIEQQYEQDWAIQMTELLLEIKETKEAAQAQGKSKLAKYVLTKFKQTYHKIIKKGLVMNPLPTPKPKKRGRPKKGKARNLLERLDKYETDILRFATNFEVPFDNNRSERSIRMMKVKQKISGCFRSLTGANYFARIRSYIMTVRKQDINVFDALGNLFDDCTIAQIVVRN